MAEVFVEIVDAVVLVIDGSDLLLMRLPVIFHRMHGIDQVIDLLSLGLEESLEEDLVEGSHVVPADHVVDPFIVDLALLDGLYQSLIQLHVLLYFQGLRLRSSLTGLFDCIPEGVELMLKGIDGAELAGKQFLYMPALFEVAGAQHVVVRGEDVGLELGEEVSDRIK